MRSARVIPIQSDPHFDIVEYCEFVREQEEMEVWEKAEQKMRADRSEPWQWRVTLMSACVLLLVWFRPWLEKVLR